MPAVIAESSINADPTKGPVHRYSARTPGRVCGGDLSPPLERVQLTGPADDRRCAATACRDDTQAATP